MIPHEQDEMLDKDLANYDLSMFSPKDILNIILQRSQVISDIPRSGRLIRSWSQGNTAPLEAMVADQGTLYVKRAIKLIETEFNALRPVLDQIKPTAFADIGCGYGVLDLFIARTYGATTHLIDLEENDTRKFGFAEEGAAYSNLGKAALFLSQNGVPANTVSTYNPAVAKLDQIKDLDLIISTLACGFHFPVDVYMPFFQSSLRKGGALILDIRQTASQPQLQALSELGKIETIHKHTKYQRVMVTT